jgi:DNA polymerase-3 subunit delta'
MNLSAQNAILKILEEPPAKVLIILIAHKAGNLIPTIHSRCRKIDFSPLSSEVMEELLRRHGFTFSQEELETLSALSAGSIGQALRFAEEDGLETLFQIYKYLAYMPQWDWVKIHKLSETLSPPSQDKAYKMFAMLFQWVFRQVLFAKARGHNSLPSYLKKSGLETYLQKSSLENLVKTCDALQTHFARTEFSNLDRREAVRGAFALLS